MKKYVGILALCLCCALLFAACGCEHEWKEANCTDPKTCVLCNETEGSPNGHSWLAATCDTPKTCEICNQTDGEAIGHSWEEASCVAPKTCATCKATEGEALGHDWQDATTDAPKTCATCQETEGSKLNVDSRFTTASTKELYGKWTSDFVMTGELIGLDGYFDDLDAIAVYTFSNIGEMTLAIEFADEAAYLAEFGRFTTELVYASFAEQGISKASADAAIKSSYNMTMEEYVADQIAQMSREELFGAFTQKFVYYVEGDQIYSAQSWNGEFTGIEYALENGVLRIEDPTMGNMDYTKAE